MLHDAHFHTEDAALLNFLMQRQISGIVNAASPKEYCRLKKWLNSTDKLHISAGIHPWKADSIQWEEMLPCFEEALIIGEIGLDNTWCEVAFNIQYEVFERQLIFAAQHHKPVILHIKGLEKEALPLLRKYKNHYFVHWYSCEDYLEEYIALDCYFSIGPSVNKDKAVQAVAQRVPLNRILLESDGLSALSWCEERQIGITDYLYLMKRSIACIEAIRKTKLNANLDDNLQAFLHSADIYES